jgi:hypothetical protein
MTVLLIFLVVLGAVAVSMLFVKLVLELWSLCGHLGPRAESIRKNYWRILFSTIVRIVLLVYGTWVLYCLYQFRSGDSWAAALLAGLTLGVFTGILIFFTIRIFYLAAKARKLEGGVDELYEHKPWMRKYGFFYDQFKSKMWWFFVPVLVYVLIRAVVIVFGAGNGLIQAIGVLTTEGIFLALLFWRRPYDGTKANVVNAMIAVVRVLSIGCILIFVEELGMSLQMTPTVGISATTTTVMGVVLLAVQSTLTIILAILIVLGAVSSCFHKRKPTVKADHKVGDLDEDLQPLSVPSIDNVTELRTYRTRSGYMPAATTEQGYEHRASTIQKAPYLQGPTPIYEEYSSSYGRAPSVAARNSRLQSIGHESAFQYRPMGSPAPSAVGRRESYFMR